MDKKLSNNADNENVNQNSQKKGEEASVENGKKAIEIQDKLEDKSEEDKHKDAAQWRNEG